jgi:tetratricopeptide (TPR) repeat protein
MPDAHQSPSFSRFLAEDQAATLREVAADRVRLANAQRNKDLVPERMIRTGIGFGLYVTANEAEAAPMLDAALSLARQLADRSAEIEVLLHLATARQHLGQRELAQSLFEAAFDLSAAHGITTFEHFILHHRGRRYAEQRRIGEAQECFERVLSLRELLGNPRFIHSTRAAIADPAHW